MRHRSKMDTGLTPPESPALRLSHFHLPILLPLLVFLLCLGLTILQGQRSRAAREREVRAYFEFRSRDIAARIQTRLQHYEQALLGTRALFLANEQVTRLAFASFVAGLDLGEHYPGIQGIGFSLLIPRAEKDGHLATLRGQGFSNYQIRPEGDREAYTSIIYLEPFRDRNLRAFGYDMLSEPVRREAMNLARDHARMRMSGKVTLVQETEQDIQPGFLLYVPVYRRGLPADRLEERRRNLIGWVYAPFRMNDLMRGVFGEGASDVGIRIFDGTNASPAALLFDRDGQPGEAPQSPLCATNTLSFGDRAWTVVTRDLPGLRARIGHSGDSTAFALGVAASLLLGFVTWVLLRELGRRGEMNRLLETRVAQRTRELAASEQKFRTLADYTVDWELWMGPRGDLLYCSPACERLCGHPPSAFMADPLLLEKVVHPEDLPKWRQHQALIHDERPGDGSPMGIDHEIDFRILDTSGALRWIGHSCHAIFDDQGAPLGRRISNRDITARKQAEEALAESRSRMEHILAGTLAGTWEWNIQTGATTINERWAEIIGYRLEELAPVDIHTWERHAHPEDLRNSERLLNLHFEGTLPYYECECRMKHREGHWVWVLDRGRITTRTADGKPLLMFGTHTDITARKALQDQLHQSQKMESLGVLAGGVAHDMNNVLASILAIASLHQRRAEPASAAHRAFTDILQACRRGGNLIRSLLGFSRKGLIEEKPLDLNRIIREEVMLLERTTQSRLRFVCVLAPDLRQMRGDPGALTQALMNLCLNAIDATPDQGVLTLRTRNLAPDQIEVEVEDTGCGMTRDVLEKAIEPFFTTKAQGKGTGLGLSIAHGTVLAHHGKMEIHSEPGKGTRVLLRFPACEPPPPELAPSNPPPAQAAGAALQVLAVDDDELFLSSILEVLEHLGHRGTGTRSGEAALEKLEAGFQPDAVILDMNMPGIGGMETLKCLRLLRPELPVLIATGRVEQNALDLARTHAFVTLMAKPFSMQDLQKYLRTIEP